MGNWTFTIEGLGAHDNGDKLPDHDANKIAEKVTNMFADAGHHLLSARFVSGGGHNTLEKVMYDRVKRAEAEKANIAEQKADTAASGPPPDAPAEPPADAPA